MSTVVSWALTGELDWSWGMFLGSTLGGLIGGSISFLFPALGIIGSSFVTGFISNAIGMGLQNVLGEANNSILDVFVSSLITAGVSAITAGITSKIKFPGFTGRGSISQVARQINSRLYNGTISKISLKTLGKLFAYEASYSILNIVVDVKYGIYQNYLKKMKEIIYNIIL